MRLPEDVRQGLADLLLDCTARITQLDGGFPAGAGFFVSDSLLVTNRHVVGPHADGQEVLVRPYGREQRQATVLPPSTSHPDLDIALIRVSPDPAASAVLLHRKAVSGRYVMAGFPREDFYTGLRPGLETREVDGDPRRENETTDLQLLRLTGIQIKPGWSGGPVLGTATGAVVAVTVYSEDPDDDLGGGGLPVDLAVRAYPELKRLAAEPPPATRRWRELLGRDSWEGLGLPWDRNDQIDIYLTGDRSCWHIGLSPDDTGPALRVQDLGDGVTDVLVGWARSSGRRDESEVRLLGRLLSAAMFPGPVTERLPAAAGREDEPVLVRLHVDAAGPLADLPWEFATHPASPKRFLAASPGFAFVRVAGDAPATTSRREYPRGAGPVDVHTIVVQPKDTTRWAPVVDAGSLIPWWSGDTIVRSLEDCIRQPKAPDGSAAFRPQSLVNRSLSDLQSELGYGAGVVHYVGFGFQEPEDRRRSGLERSWIVCDAGMEDVDNVRPHRAHEILEMIAERRPALVILEFGVPPLDLLYDWYSKGYQPIGPGLLEAVATYGFGAMVCTRPLHPIQYDQFNRFFYRHLAAGRTVEQSVQLARQALMVDGRLDYAGFGWFMAATGPMPRLRFFAGPSRSDHKGLRPMGSDSDAR